MVRFVISASILLSSVSAMADFSSTVTLSSNNVWRGTSVSLGGDGTAASGSPVIQGTIDYAHSSGFGIGIFAGNSDSTDYSNGNATVVKDTETDVNINYNFEASEDVTVGAYAFWYNYLNNPSNNSMEYNVYVTYDFLKLEYSYMPTFFGADTVNQYSKLSARFNVNEKFGLLAHVGFSMFDDHELMGHKDYLDYRAGFFFEAKPLTVEIALTDTDRADLDGKSFKDRAVTISAIIGF